MVENLTKEITNIKSKIDQLYLHKQSYLPGLLHELGGICLFYFYYGKVFNDPVSSEKGNILVDHILDGIKDSIKYKNYRFSTGAAGLGWLLKFLHKEDFIDFEVEDALSDLDEYIYRFAIEEINRDNYDFLHGAIGALYYFTEGANTTNGYIEDITSKLSSGTKTTIYNKPYWPSFNVSEGKKYDETINFGLSHGQPAIVSLLSKVYELNSSNELKKLLSDATYAMLDFKFKMKKKSLFPTMTSAIEDIEKNMSRGARLGWCYGDLGVGVSLWNVGQVIQNEDFKKMAFDCINFSASKRDLNLNSIKDAAVCHGAAGVMHIFSKFSYLNKEADYSEAIEYWKNITLEMIHSEEEKYISGHCAWHNERGYYNDFGFLQGLSGVGLSLLSLIDTDIKWGDVLLM
ncbi:lanthionine synthetase LanC family protein [Chryseobacterium gleum]|uniref:lanthionine synthetase LanC family protein n=1 Tax=Chryseobacterium gleum TaxID=250 RepID=UPI00241E4837|nr:lanthionine synthetase LanC family protein [Chryseobacterium gleum]